MKNQNLKMLSLGAVLMLLACSLTVNAMFITGKMGAGHHVENVAWEARAPEYAMNSGSMIELPPMDKSLKGKSRGK